MPDSFVLDRFIDAQDGVYGRVLDELGRGAKQSHWMWFVFPQIAGLGSSPMAQRFAIASLDEARAYLAHPLLGARLLECTGLANHVQDRTAHAIFGSPDDLKFRSSMTLFDRAAPRQAPFRDALARYYGGRPDGRTLALLCGTGGTAPARTGPS